eukprot:scpid75161/ scgid6727/ Probable RNA-directed DNA polymerase from transposon BS; Reverse transcriptase
MNKLQQMAECDLCPIQTNALNNSHLNSTSGLHNKSRHLRTSHLTSTSRLHIFSSQWPTTFHQCPEGDIATLRDARHHIALCFFDLAKAFDTVWHRGLLAKLHIVFGVSGPALSWLESYLSSRSQFVFALSINSDPLPVSSGVPQGSILGPLLFVAYVNDLPSIDPVVSLFADDTTLLSASSSSAALVPRVSAQICSVLRWMQTWRLRPNLTKTEIMFLPPISSMSLLHHPDFPEPIKVVSNHKHLGIMLDDRLSWSFHIDALCSRSSSALGVIRPHCFHLPFKCKILFYKLYILPLFMYAAVSWCGLSSVLAERLKIHL